MTHSWDFPVDSLQIILWMWNVTITVLAPPGNAVQSWSHWVYMLACVMSPTQALPPVTKSTATYRSSSVISRWGNTWSHSQLRGKEPAQNGISQGTGEIKKWGLKMDRRHVRGKLVQKQELLLRFYSILEAFPHLFSSEPQPVTSSAKHTGWMFSFPPPSHVEFPPTIYVFY